MGLRNPIFGKTKYGFVIFPFFNVSYIGISISLRNGSATAFWGDGDSNIITTQNFDFTSFTSLIPYGHNYSTVNNRDVNIKVEKGAKDVYSIALTGALGPTQNQNKYNIQNFGLWIKQFPNLYSIRYQIHHFSIDANRSIIKGALLDIPISVERIMIGDLNIVNEATDLSLNLDDIPVLSNLKFFHKVKASSLKVLTSIKGSISNLPTVTEIFKIDINSIGIKSKLTYSSSKVWATAFDTFDISIAITDTELLNMLSDMSTYIYTSKGDKTISLPMVRYANSDSYVNDLVSKGFNVSMLKVSDTVLKLPLSSDLIDTSSYLSHATMVGTETHSNNGLIISTSNHAYIPNKTSLNIGNIGIHFGCEVKFNSITDLMGILGKLVYADAPGRFGFYCSAGYLFAQYQFNATTAVCSIALSDYNDGEFHKLDCIVNKTKGTIILLIDNIMVATSTFIIPATVSNRVARFMIGGYGNSTGTGIQSGSEFKGIIRNVIVNQL